MKYQINLLHLKYFCDAMTCSSISEAAKQNYVTQSTVSQAIAKLELCVGVPLIVHSRQKFQFTEEGKIVFDQARHIFKAVQDIQDKINFSKEKVSGSLKFVTTNSLGMSYIAHSYQKMGVEFPEIDISFQLGNLNFIRNALRKGEAEFAIVVYDDSFSEFSKRPIRKGQFGLYQHVNAPFTVIDKGILIDSKLGIHVDALMSFFSDRGEALKIQAELAGWEVVARFTEMNIGVGFLPDYILGNNRYPQLTKYQIDFPSFRYEICAVYNKGVRLSRVASLFLEQCLT